MLSAILDADDVILMCFKLSFGDLNISVQYNQMFDIDSYQHVDASIRREAFLLRLKSI